MTKEQLIQEFSAAAELDARARALLDFVLAQSPRTLMITWETDTGLKIATVPASNMVARGMIETAKEMLDDSLDLPARDADADEDEDDAE